jgi:hypothetical protein
MYQIKKLKESSCEKLFNDMNNADLNDNLSKSYSEHKILDFKSLTQGLDRIDGASFDVDDRFFSSYDQLNLNTDGNGTYDFENAKIIFELFNDLSPSDANDERLWTRLTHDHCHKYVVERWMKSSSAKDKKTQIKERFFFRGDSKAARVRNGIARLWWIAYLTVNLNTKDDKEKWALTEAIFESQDFVTSILERDLGTYTNVRSGILEFYLDNKDLFKNEKGKKIQRLVKDINNYGGVSLLALLNKTQVKNIISELMNKVNVK